MKPTKHDGFKVVDSYNDDNQLATILEFKPEDSDLPIEETKEFVQYLINLYNKSI